MELLRYHAAGLGSGRTYMYHLNYPASSTATAGGAGSQHEAETGSTSSAFEDMRGSFHDDGVFNLLGLALINSNPDTAGSNTEEMMPHSTEEIEVSEQLIAYVAGFCFAGYM